MAEMVLSSAEKAKIQSILPTLTFVNEEEANKFRCLVCGDVAIYHYFAICKHVFCGKCHSKLHHTSCPIKGCTNKFINEISQDKDFEFGINNLQVYCVHKSHGCKETETLFNILSHRAECKYATEKLLPKLWNPPKKSKYDAKLEEDLIQLTKVGTEIHEWQSKCKVTENSVNSRMCIVENALGQWESKLENTNQKFEELSSYLEDSLKETSSKLKDDLLIDITMKLIKRFDLNIYEKIDQQIGKEKENLENLIKFTMCRHAEESESNSKERTEELANRMEGKLIDILDEKLNITKHQMEENVNRIIADVDDMKKSNKVQCIRNLDQQKTAIEEMHTELNTKIDENYTIVLANSKMKDEELRNLVESETGLQARLKNVEDNIITKENSKEEQEQLMQFMDEKISSLKEYILLDQPAEFSWKISGINQIVKDWINGGKREILSKEFHSIVYGNILQCKLENNGISSFNIELKIDSYCPNSSRVYLHRRTFSILDQSGTETKRDIRQVNMPGFGKIQATEWMTGFHKAPWSIPTKVLEGNSRYIKDDCIVVKMMTEPLSLLYKSVCSRDGTMVWTLDNYNQKKQDWLEEIGPCVQSPQLYTGEMGYLVHLELRVGKQLIGFFLSFDLGEHDNNLGVEFSHTATVTIINQSGENDDENSTISISKKTTEATSSPIGYIPIKTVELPKYLIDDRVLIKFQFE